MKKMSAARNLLMTVVVSLTGAVSNTSSVPVRFSSLSRRMVITGTTKATETTGIKWTM